MPRVAYTLAFMLTGYDGGPLIAKSSRTVTWPVSSSETMAVRIHQNWSDYMRADVCYLCGLDTTSSFRNRLSRHDSIDAWIIGTDSKSFEKR